jgi:hypothetical protein
MTSTDCASWYCRRGPSAIQSGPRKRSSSIGATSSPARTIAASLIRQLQGRQFGKRLEKLDPDQLNLRLEDLEQAVAPATETTGKARSGAAAVRTRAQKFDCAQAGRVRFSRRAARHLPIAERRAMIAPEAGLSVSRQCTLLGIARSSFYYRPRPERVKWIFWSGSTGFSPTIQSTAAAASRWRCCERASRLAADESGG